MPTLGQLEISTRTRENLAGIKRRRPNDIIDRHPPPENKASNNNSSVTASFVPIQTPSALLARNPLHLSNALSLSLDDLKALRGSVAHALISDACVGHSDRPAALVAGVSRFCLCRDFVVRGRSDGHDENELDGRGFHATLRPMPWIVGSISGLELCAHSLLMRSGGDVWDHLETGSEALDELLARHASLDSLEQFVDLSYPFCIPKKDVDSNVGKRGIGIPFGMVTEFSGPPSCGKTQLSLSVVARSVMQQDRLRVVYVLSGGNGKAVSRRLFSLCVEAGRRFGNGEREAKVLAERALERVSVVCVSDAYSLLALLAKIEGEDIISGPRQTRCGTLLVIDSISGCIGHHLSASSLAVGAALVNQVGLTLRRMARSLDCRFDTAQEDDVNNESIGIHPPPRRFAVIVTNGSVANWLADGNNAAVAKKATNKPAMGRYWHVSDIGLWLEEDKSHYQQSDGASFHLQDFYSDTPVAGLHFANKKVVRATLLNHYGKSCSGKEKSSVQFVVRSGGVDDVSG